jgi:hypothetical protein
MQNFTLYCLKTAKQNAKNAKNNEKSSPRLLIPNVVTSQPSVSSLRVVLVALDHLSVALSKVILLIGLGVELNHPPTGYYTHAPGNSGAWCTAPVRSSRMEVCVVCSVSFVVRLT